MKPQENAMECQENLIKFIEASGKITEKTKFNKNVQNFNEIVKKL